MEPIVEDRRQQTLLMKISEWSNILQLLTVVFGGGMIYQKLENLAEVVKTSTSDMTILKSEISTLKIEMERQRGRDAVIELEVSTLKARK